MSGFFGEQSGVDDFALPGDDEKLAALGVEQEADAGRARDETGRFVAETPEPVEEPAVEEPAVEAPAAEVAELILGKFKTQEEANAAYLELEKHAGSLRNELGERRATEAELAERLAAIEQHVAQPRQQQTPVSQEFIDSNPAAATQAAWAQGDTATTIAALEVWKQDDPAGAVTWAMTQQMEAREQAMRQEMRETLAQYDERLAPLTEQASSQGLQASVVALAAKYPDLGAFVAGDELAELAEQVPLAREALASGDTDKMISGLETLYLIHRGRATDNLTDVSREVARTAAEEGQKVREEAFVASATATAGTATASRAEQLSEGWDDVDNRFKAGWNV